MRLSPVITLVWGLCFGAYLCALPNSTCGIELGGQTWPPNLGLGLQLQNKTEDRFLIAENLDGGTHWVETEHFFYPNRVVQVTRTQFVPRKGDVLLGVNGNADQGWERYLNMMNPWVNFACDSYGRFPQAYRDGMWNTAVRYALQAHHFTVYDRGPNYTLGNIAATFRLILAPYVRWQLPRPLFFIDDNLEDQSVFETFGAHGEAWESLHGGYNKGSTAFPSPFGWGQGVLSIPTERYINKWLPREASLEEHIYTYPKDAPYGLAGKQVPYKWGKSTLFDPGLLAIRKDLNKEAWVDVWTHLIRHLVRTDPLPELGYTMGPKLSVRLHHKVGCRIAKYINIDACDPSVELPIIPLSEMKYSDDPISRDGMEWYLLSLYLKDLINMILNIQGAQSHYSPEEEAAVREVFKYFAALDVYRSGSVPLEDIMKQLGIPTE